MEVRTDGASQPFKDNGTHRTQTQDPQRCAGPGGNHPVVDMHAVKRNGQCQCIEHDAADGRVYQASFVL